MQGDEAVAGNLRAQPVAVPRPVGVARRFASDLDAASRSHRLTAVAPFRLAQEGQAAALQARSSARGAGRLDRAAQRLPDYVRS